MKTRFYEWKWTCDHVTSSGQECDIFGSGMLYHINHSCGHKSPTAHWMLCTCLHPLSTNWEKNDWAILHHWVTGWLQVQHSHMLTCVFVYFSKPETICQQYTKSVLRVRFDHLQVQKTYRGRCNLTLVKTSEHNQWSWSISLTSLYRLIAKKEKKKKQSEAGDHATQIESNQEMAHMENEKQMTKEKRLKQPQGQVRGQQKIT